MASDLEDFIRLYMLPELTYERGPNGTAAMTLGDQGLLMRNGRPSMRSSLGDITVRDLPEQEPGTVNLMAQALDNMRSRKADRGRFPLSDEAALQLLGNRVTYAKETPVLARPGPDVLGGNKLRESAHHTPRGPVLAIDPSNLTPEQIRALELLTHTPR